MRGIKKTAGVCGGAACVEGTRIPVWVLVGLRDLGDERILENFPALTAGDLRNALDYYALHPDEIDRDIRENNPA